MAVLKPQWPSKIISEQYPSHKIINGKVCNRVRLYQFNMGDVEDPELYAAGPLYDWQQSEVGKWCMENAQEPPTFNTHVDYQSYGYKCTIIGYLSAEDCTFFNLKWGQFV